MLQKIENSFKENVRNNTLCAKSGSRAETFIKNEADETDSSPDPRTESDSPSSTLCGLNSDASETSSSFKIELGKSESEKKAALRRYQDFQKWMWKECYNSSILCAMKYGKKRCKPQVDICDICHNTYFFEDSHCNSCHRTFPSNNEFNFSKHAFQCGDKLSTEICTLDSSLPIRTRFLKALLALIEASVPLEAFQSIWTEDIRRHWGMKLSKSSSVAELLQILTLFESALKRDFISSTFSTTEELLGLSTTSECPMDPELVSVVPWVPRTTAAVSLRLLEFDASVMYVQQPEPRGEKEVYAKLPSRYNPVKSSKVVEPANLDASMKIVGSSNKQRCVSNDKGRGKKLSKRMHDSNRDSGRRNVKVSGNPSQRKKQQGQQSERQAGVRGRRTVRKRRSEKRDVEDLLLGHKTATHNASIGGESLRLFDEDWDDEKESPMTPIHMGAPDISNNTEVAESDDNVQVGESDDNVQGVESDDSDQAVESDDNGQAMESDDDVEAVEYDQGNWEIGFHGTPNRWSRDMAGMIDEDVEASEDDNDNRVEENEEEELEEADDDSDGMVNGVINEESSDSAMSDDSSD